VNPAAGSGKSAAAVSIIENIMRENNIGCSFIYTNRASDFERISNLIDFERADSVVCVGGDGTIQEYIGLAVGRKINFGVIPAGSGNDLINSIPDADGNIMRSGKYNCPVKRRFDSFEKKIIYFTDKIIQNNIIPADVISVNGGEKYLFNIGGTGIDIQVLKDALPLKRIFGGASYFISLIKNVVNYKTDEITLTADGKSETGEFLLLAFCNGAYYGGGLCIAPPANINDGLMTLCKTKKMPRLKLIAMFPKTKTGGHINLKEVEFLDCSFVKLEFGGVKTINLDGNLFEFASPLTFEVIKNAVNLIV